MVSDAEAADAWPDRLDDSGRFVPTTEREVTDGDVTSSEMIVRVAQAGCNDAHKDLVVARLVQLDRVHLPLPRHLSQ